MHSVTLKRGFLFWFPLAYVAFYLVYLCVPDSVLSTFVYRYTINEPAAFFIRLLASDVVLRVEQHRILAPGMTLEIVRGCDGSGAFFLAAAAILAVGARLRVTLLGLTSAAITVFVLNEARVIALYFTAIYRPAWFTTLHVYLIPLLMIVMLGMLFSVWLRMALAASARPD
jgi:exosortase family protein XrtM